MLTALKTVSLGFRFIMDQDINAMNTYIPEIFFYSNLRRVKYREKVFHYKHSDYVLGLVPAETLDVREAERILASTSLSRSTFENNPWGAVM